MVHLGQDRLDSRHFTLHVRIIGAEARQLRQNAGIVEVSVLLLQIRAVFGGDGSNLKVAGLPSAHRPAGIGDLRDDVFGISCVVDALNAIDHHVGISLVGLDQVDPLHSRLGLG